VTRAPPPASSRIQAYWIAVGVLELVHQQMAKALVLIVMQQFGVVQPQLVGAQQQLGEIDHVGALAGGFVGLVNLDQRGQLPVALRLDPVWSDAPHPSAH
jgi:hypothetical protein